MHLQSMKAGVLRLDALPKTTAVEQPHSPVRDYFRRLARENTTEL